MCSTYVALHTVASGHCCNYRLFLTLSSTQQAGIVTNILAITSQLDVIGIMSILWSFCSAALAEYWVVCDQLSCISWSLVNDMLPVDIESII